MILVVIAVIGIVGLLVWRFLASSGVPVPLFPGTKTSSYDSDFAKQYPCTERDVTFTSPPMKMEELGYIRPLGAMLDGHVTPTDHVYVGPIDSNVPDNTYPVLMPADGTVIAVGRMPDQYIGDMNGVSLPVEDHRMTVSFNCRYYSIFIHIHKLSDPVKAAVGQLQANENKMVSVELKAGDPIGYIGGSTFDWTPLDVSKQLTGFISPELYKTESWKIHTVSPFDWYEGELKAQLEAKSWRTKDPIGGRIDYDVAGSLQGNWFREGTNGYEGANRERYWDGHLSVVPDYLDPDYSVVSIGNWDGKATQLVVAEMVNLDEITASDGIVTFELAKLSYTGGLAEREASIKMERHPDISGEVVGSISFQVLDGEKLKVEKFIGKRASEVTGFTSAAQTYER
jgi:hypothetical protein